MKNSRRNKESNKNLNPSNLTDIRLKDGRRVYTTHNNFKHFVEDRSIYNSIVRLL